MVCFSRSNRQQFFVKAAMAKQFIGALVCAMVLGCVRSAQLEWLTDADQALAKARAERKLVLLNFTGSDWCPWCIRLEREVFSQPEFLSYAQTNLVLVLVDFPRKKQLSQEQKRSNNALAVKYGINGFPTIVVLDHTGKTLGKLGYMEGGPKRFIAELEKLRAPLHQGTSPDAGQPEKQKPQEKAARNSSGLLLTHTQPAQ